MVSMIIQEITNDMAQQQNVEDLWAALDTSHNNTN